MTTEHYSRNAEAAMLRGEPRDAESLSVASSPSITRLEDHGSYRRYLIWGGDPERYVTVLVSMHDGKHRLDQAICCRVSLYQWPELFEGYRGYRGIPNGFTITDAGRALFVAADREGT